MRSRGTISPNRAWGYILTALNHISKEENFAATEVFLKKLIIEIKAGKLIFTLPEDIDQRKRIAKTADEARETLRRILEREDSSPAQYYYIRQLIKNLPFPISVENVDISPTTTPTVPEEYVEIWRLAESISYKTSEDSKMEDLRHEIHRVFSRKTLEEIRGWIRYIETGQADFLRNSGVMPVKAHDFYRVVSGELKTLENLLSNIFEKPLTDIRNIAN